MGDDPMMVDCFLCKGTFRFGQNRYDGRAIGQWKINICRSCLAGNHDGIVPESHPDLEPHLRSIGIEPSRNAKGWIDIPN